MNVLTEDLKNRIYEYLESIAGDYDSQEFKNCKEILEENVGGTLSEIDNTILSRIIDDDKLIEEIEAITEEQSGNAFD